MANLTSIDAEELKRILKTTDPAKLHKMADDILQEVIDQSDAFVGTEDAAGALGLFFSMASYIEARAAYFEAEKAYSEAL